PRGEPLVVELDGHVNGGAQASREGPGRRRLLALLALERQRQPHHHEPGLRLVDELGERLHSRGGLRTLDRAQRDRHRPGRIGHRRATARRAVVEGEDARHESARSMARRAAAIASGSLSGSRPPAWAMVSRPPPPPPTCSAASRITSTALTPRLTTSRSGTRSIVASSRSSSLRSRDDSIPAAPVSASIRRTFAALEPSLTISKTPTSAVDATCVPPQSSRETSSTSTIRTQSPYFSPKSAIAPIASAASRVVCTARTGWCSTIHRFTMSSI